MTALVGRRARGQALVWFALTLPVLVLAFGLVADGTVLFAAHRRALLLADSAARAGAGQLDVAALRANPGGTTRLDPGAAGAAATAHVARQEPAASTDATASAERIVVRVRLLAPTILLHPPGAAGTDVVAQAEAEPFRGVESPRR